jgi:HlyD family secretion protein
MLILLGALLAGIAYGVHAWQNTKAEPIAYTVTPVEFGTLDEVVSATGLVHPRETFVVGSEQPGKVVAVLADYNQVVEEGDVLLRLDDRMARERLKQAEIAVQLAQVAVKQAESNRETADKAVKRLREMSESVRSQTDVDIAEGKLRAVEVAVEAAQLKVREAEDARAQAELGLRLTTIRAPVLEAAVTPAGTVPPSTRPGTGVLSEEPTPSRSKRSFVVLDRKVSLNQQIGPPLQGQLFILAADLNRMRVMAQVGEGEIDKVRRGMAAHFTVSGAGEDAPRYSGKVEDIHLVPASEHGAVYYKVLIDARNERDGETGDWQLRPGLTASVDIIRRSHESVWKLPTAALNFEPPAAQRSPAAWARREQLESRKDRSQWQTVWIVGTDGKPWPVFVRTGGKNARGETGIQDGQFTEVLEWDPELKPALDPKKPSGLQVITNAPPPKKGMFSIPSIKF